MTSLADRLTGRRCGTQVVRIDRAPVSNFAAVLQDPSPVYRDPRAARARGFADIPAPPTFPFAMLHWGTAPELTEEFGGDPVPPNPQGEILEHLGHIGHVMAELMTELGPGLVLHAEQDYEYHRPILVGDVLRGENAISDVYRRDDKTFVVIQTHWVDVQTGNPVLTGRFGVVHLPNPRETDPEGPTS